jgi:triacylglycerol esterase/lipase EstA (alpha/beta hydrolase family)
MSRTRSALIAIAAAAASVAMVAPPSGAATHDPVVFVHGWNGSGSNWDTMKAAFKSDGYTDAELDEWTYDTAQSNKTTATQLSQEVDAVLARTGASKVDIVSHSMGGLNSRWYLKFDGGTSKVDHWVSLAGPNHGTNTAGACAGTQVSCQEMQAGSGFLATLNSGDETPGAVNYRTWWSPCDEVISPQQSTILNGATNTETGCIGHLQFLSDPTVSQQVRAFVEH